jgi:hypothetical protein
VTQDWHAYFVDRRKARELAALLFKALGGKDMTLEELD